MFKFLICACLASLVPAIAAAAPACPIPEGKPQKFETAILIIEDNKGDGDYSLVGKFAAEGWTELCVFDPQGNLLLHTKPDGRLARLGVGGVTFESREPAYREVSYAALKKAFPEGEYKLLATGMDGHILTGAATLSAALPAMPDIITPVTVPERDGKVPVVPVGDLVVQWKPVSSSQDGEPIAIRGYQVLINKENHEDARGFSRPGFDVHLGPKATSFMVPAAFFDPASLYEIEVGAIAENGNQTLAGASFFRTK